MIPIWNNSSFLRLNAWRITRVEHLHRVDDPRPSWVDEFGEGVVWTSWVDERGGRVVWMSWVDKCGEGEINKKS